MSIQEGGEGGILSRIFGKSVSLKKESSKNFIYEVIKGSIFDIIFYHLKNQLRNSNDYASFRNNIIDDNIKLFEYLSLVISNSSLGTNNGFNYSGLSRIITQEDVNDINNIYSKINNRLIYINKNTSSNIVKYLRENRDTLIKSIKISFKIFKNTNMGTIYKKINKGRELNSNSIIKEDIKKLNQFGQNLTYDILDNLFKNIFKENYFPEDRIIEERKDNKEFIPGYYQIKYNSLKTYILNLNNIQTGGLKKTLIKKKNVIKKSTDKSTIDKNSVEKKSLVKKQITKKTITKKQIH